ncbi:DUF1980 domain-containing protein [Peribacillus simplex]|uniref:DUF1980 domain-containing protein n=1 Tax=Peribacillus simplex TaxID=1478 RepID=UPI003D26AB1E
MNKSVFAKFCKRHSYENDKNTPSLRRLLHYVIFIFPLATGIFLPIATFDSTEVKSKGFSFQTMERNG